jgi:hypothetical protein
LCFREHKYGDICAPGITNIAPKAAMPADQAAQMGNQSSIDMYDSDVGKESAQKFMKQTGALKAATLYFAS